MSEAGGIEVDMRRFGMHRGVDRTGVSGTGHIADGVVFDDGTVVVRWKTTTPGTTIFESIAHAQAVHGHDGLTKFIFHDDNESEEKKLELVWLCCMCFSDMDVPLNHCFQCGSGGSRVAMDRAQLQQIQRHDQDRLNANRELQKELIPLRRIAIAVVGGLELGLSVSRRTSSGGHVMSVVSGDVSYGIHSAADTLDDDAVLRAFGADARIDPDRSTRVADRMDKIHQARAVRFMTGVFDETERGKRRE